MMCLPFWRQKEKRKERINVEDINTVSAQTQSNENKKYSDKLSFIRRVDNQNGIKQQQRNPIKIKYNYSNLKTERNKELNVVENYNDNINTNSYGLHEKLQKQFENKQIEYEVENGGRSDAYFKPDKNFSSSSDRIRQQGYSHMYNMMNELSAITDEGDGHLEMQKRDLDSGFCDMSIPSASSDTLSSGGTTNTRHDVFDIILDPTQLEEFLVDDNEIFNQSDVLPKREKKTGLPINRVKTAFKTKSSFLQYEKKRVSFYKEDDDALASDRYSRMFKYLPASKFDTNLLQSKDFREALAKLPPRTTKPIWDEQKHKITLQKLNKKQKKKVEGMAEVYSVKRRDQLQELLFSSNPINDSGGTSNKDSQKSGGTSNKDSQKSPTHAKVKHKQTKLPQIKS